MRRHDSVDAATVARVSSLDDPVRRRLYEVVASRESPISRDDAAKAVGISRTLAAYHLDRLAQARLVHVSYARPEGRRGPGAGRPAKLYIRADDELALSLPPRDYELLAELLVESVEHDASGATRAAVHRAAAAAGERSGEAAGGDVIRALSERGYQPVQTAAGDVELRNCPFHHLAQDHQDLVCGLNFHLIRGVLSGSGQEADRAELCPRAGRCCVVVHADAR